MLRVAEQTYLRDNWTVRPDKTDMCGRVGMREPLTRLCAGGTSPRVHVQVVRDAVVAIVVGERGCPLEHVVTTGE